MKQLIFLLQFLWWIPAKSQDPFRAYLSIVPPITLLISYTLTGQGADAIVAFLRERSRRDTAPKRLGLVA